MTNGPMQVGYMVYQDFYLYQSGIYEVTSSTPAGGHAVLLYGWDHDVNGRLYWLMQNQWGEDWGENGFFRIYAGESGIDSNPYGCTPDMSSH